MNKKAKIALITSVLLVALLTTSIVIAAPGKGKVKAACSDGFDNDGDGQVDYPADPGCSSKRDRDEYNVPVAYCGDLICNNGESCSTCEQDCGVCPPVCGDGVSEGTEECDEGANNGVACTPSYGESCTYCDEVCTETYLTGSYCGDAVCDTEEACDICSQDCGACPIQDSCMDTDSNNIHFIGQVLGYTNELFFNNTDYCITNTTIVEYLCVGTQPTTETTNCPVNYNLGYYGWCAGGKCI